MMQDTEDILVLLAFSFKKNYICMVEKSTPYAVRQYFSAEKKLRAFS